MNSVQWNRKKTSFDDLIIFFSFLLISGLCLPNDIKIFIALFFSYFTYFAITRSSWRSQPTMQCHSRLFTPSAARRWAWSNAFAAVFKRKLDHLVGLGRKTIRFNYLNELYCDRTFADTAGADDYKLVGLNTTAVLGHAEGGREKTFGIALKKLKNCGDEEKCKLFLRDISWRLSRFWLYVGLDSCGFEQMWQLCVSMLRK